MNALGPRVQRFAALGLLVLCLLAVQSLLVAPYLARYQANHHRIDRLQARLAAYQRLEARKAELARIEHRLQQDRRLARCCLSAATDALATAELQRLLNERVKAAGGRITSAQPVGATGAGTVGMATLRLRLQTTTGQLGPLLRALEANAPLLVIDNLSIHSRSRQLQGRSSANDTLDVTMDLSAFLRGERS